jgi:hypothetical protein
MRVEKQSRCLAAKLASPVESCDSTIVSDESANALKCNEELWIERASQLKDPQDLKVSVTRFAS